MNGGLAIGDKLSGFGAMQCIGSDGAVNIGLLSQCQLHGLDVPAPTPSSPSEAFNFGAHGLTSGHAMQPEEMQPRPAPTQQLDGLGM